MDRYNGRISKMNGTAAECVAARKTEAARAAEAGYRDYFAEALAFVCRVLSHYAFRFAFSAVGFISVLVFTLGIAGGIQLEALSLACGIPMCVMLLCILGFLNKARK